MTYKLYHTPFPVGASPIAGRLISIVLCTCPSPPVRHASPELRAVLQKADALSVAVALDGGAKSPPAPKGFREGLKALIPTKSERKKLLPLALMFFCILFNYTILRDTKVRIVLRILPSPGRQQQLFFGLVPCVEYPCYIHTLGCPTVPYVTLV